MSESARRSKVPVWNEDGHCLQNHWLVFGGKAFAVPGPICTEVEVAFLKPHSHCADVAFRTAGIP